MIGGAASGVGDDEQGNTGNQPKTIRRVPGAIG
jgi:hypothetical protein